MQTRSDKHLSQFKNSRTSRFRQNHRENIQNLLLSQDEEEDRRSNKKMRCVRQSEAQLTQVL